MSSVCRICLAGNMRLLSVKNNLLIDVYEKLSNNKFNSKDARPRALCCYCYGQLLKCYTFSQMAKRSENVLSQLFHEGLEATHEYITGVNPGRNPPLSISSMRYATTYDNATDEGSLVIIKDEPTPSIDIKIEVIAEQDEMVEVESKDRLKLEADQMNSAEELPTNLNVKQPKPNDLKMLFRCNYCNNVYFLKSELASHLKKLHSPNKEKHYSLTEQHIEQNTIKDKDKTITNGNKLFACNDCDKKYERKYHYIRHQRTHTEDKLFACSVCDKQFPIKSILLKHMRIHTGDKPFVCNVCGKQFNRKDTLTTHMRTHTSEKPFVCNVGECGKQFRQKGQLVSHMTTHSGEKPFACSVCDKQFSLKSVMIKHMRIHTGYKPFACSVCGKKFNRKGHLNVHMIIHTGEKPFACDVCDKQLRDKYTLDSHMKIHTGEKPFACKNCDKQFREKKKLVTHMKIHLGEKPSACNVGM